MKIAVVVVHIDVSLLLLKISIFIFFSIKIASSKRHQKSSSKDLSGIGKKVAEKSGGLFSPEDWMCKRLLFK
jgi:hypothetical protein